MRARRALLYMPGDDMHKIEKAIDLGVDCICMDIEDGVAYNRKEYARRTIVEALNTHDFGRSEKLVRINPVGSGMEQQDLDAVLPAHPEGLVLPKVGDAQYVQWVSQQAAQVERAQGWPEGQIALLALIETAKGVVNLKEISGSDPRLQALIFGAEDLAGDMGLVRTRGGQEVLYPRSATAIHAAAFGLQAIDIVFMDLKNQVELKVECMQGVQMGYTGKQVIHPNQVGPAQDTFTPSDEAVAHARRVVEAAEEHQKTGVGAFTLDGRMVDAPVVKAAQWVLERARAAGKI